MWCWTWTQPSPTSTTRGASGTVAEMWEPGFPSGSHWPGNVGLGNCRGHKQEEAKIDPGPCYASIQSCCEACFVLTPCNSSYISVAGAAFFHSLNQDISFPRAGEKNRLLWLQPEQHLPLSDFFPLLPLLPNNGNCFKVAAARTSVTYSTDSLVAQGCICVLYFILKKRYVFRLQLSLHRWNPCFSFGEA